MTVQILQGGVFDVLATLPDESVHCVVTSPPYWGLRDYGVAGQIGLEPTMAEFVETMVRVFREVRRVLREDGTVWMNLGDSYNANGRNGHGTRVGYKQQTNRASANGDDNNRPTDASLKEKDLCMIPSRVALALQDDGWWVRSEIVWAKPNPMPESVTDRPASAHEKVFLLTKSARYFYDHEAVQVPFADSRAGASGVRDGVPEAYASVSGRGGDQGLANFNGTDRNGATLRNVWTITTKPYADAHFATFPPELPETCIKAGCPVGGTVLDPFGGAGTTGLVADRLGRNAILIELNPEYAEMARTRIVADGPLFAEVNA